MRVSSVILSCAVSDSDPHRPRRAVRRLVQASAVILAMAFLIVDAGCGLVEPRASASLTGRLYDVVSIGGRTLPTVAHLPGRGQCDGYPTDRSTFAFAPDGVFRWTVTGPSAVFTYVAQYSEPISGKLGLDGIRPFPDSIFVSGDTVRVRLAFQCEPDLLVAVAH